MTRNGSSYMGTIVEWKGKNVRIRLDNGEVINAHGGAWKWLPPSAKVLVAKASGKYMVTGGGL